MQYTWAPPPDIAYASSGPWVSGSFKTIQSRGRPGAHHAPALSSKYPFKDPSKDALGDAFFENTNLSNKKYPTS